MEKLLLKHNRSLGDIVMMTSALRDLHVSHPNKFLTDVKTSCREVWENNPYVTPFDEKASDVRIINCEYGDLIQHSNTRPYHFIHAFRKNLEDQLKLKIDQTKKHGDIYMSDHELENPPLFEKDIKKYWVISVGGKLDFTAKWWNPNHAQKVIDHFKNKITFIQVGRHQDFHPNLIGDNVINLIGQTSLRDLIRIIYFSEGVLCGVTSHMHLAASLPKKDGSIRPCVVIAGGREPDSWESYSGHKFLSMVGRLPCCSFGGCWKTKATITDGTDSSVCLNTIDMNQQIRLMINKKSPKGGQTVTRKTLKLEIPKCMDMITPNKVIEAIEEYYEGGVLSYD